MNWRYCYSLPLTGKVASMANTIWYAALLTTPFATSLVPLTIRLIPLITQIALLIQQFRATEPCAKKAREGG